MLSFYSFFTRSFFTRSFFTRPAGEKEVVTPNAQSQVVLGIVGKGFTLDRTTMEHFYFKARTNATFIIVPHLTWSLLMPTFTKTKIMENRNMVLEHVLQNKTTVRRKKKKMLVFVSLILLIHFFNSKKSSGIATNTVTAEATKTAAAAAA